MCQSWISRWNADDAHSPISSAKLGLLSPRPYVLSRAGVVLGREAPLAAPVVPTGRLHDDLRHCGGKPYDRLRVLESTVGVDPRQGVRVGDSLALEVEVARLGVHPHGGAVVVGVSWINTHEI